MENFTNFYNTPDEGRKGDEEKSYHRFPVAKILAPDVRFDPVQVHEVKCAELYISSQYMDAVGQVSEILEAS